MTHDTIDVLTDLCHPYIFFYKPSLPFVFICMLDRWVLIMKYETRVRTHCLAYCIQIQLRFIFLHMYTRSRSLSEDAMTFERCNFIFIIKGVENEYKKLHKGRRDQNALRFFK